MGGRLDVWLASSRLVNVTRTGLDNTSDLIGGPPVAGRDHDQKLHYGVIDVGTARLHNEDILLSDTRQDPNTCLALREARGRKSAERLMVPHTTCLVGKACNVWTGRRRGGEIPTFENWVSSALAGVMPKFSHIFAVSPGHELPENMRVLRISNGCRKVLTERLGELLFQAGRCGGQSGQRWRPWSC